MTNQYLHQIIKLSMQIKNDINALKLEGFNSLKKISRFNY